MKNLLKKSWFYELISNVIVIILGICLLFFAKEIISSLFVVLGILMMISGITIIIGEALSKNQNETNNIRGVICLVLGLLVSIGSNFLSDLIPFVLVIYFIFSGVNKIFEASRVKVIGYSYWWIKMIVGIFITIFGFVLLFLPDTTDAFGVVAGIFLIVQGVFNIFNQFVFRKKIKVFVDQSIQLNAITCPRCHQNVTKNNIYCPHCGYKIQDEFIDVEIKE